MRDLLAREAREPARRTPSRCSATGQEVDWIVCRGARRHRHARLLGGIGEHAPLIRRGFCSGLGFLGIQLWTRPRTEERLRSISTDERRVPVRVIPTDEERMIAQSVMIPRRSTLEASLNPNSSRTDRRVLAGGELSVGRADLPLDNPLLSGRWRLPTSSAAARALGHDARPEFHLRAPESRRSRSYDLDMIYISGPGHGGPAVVANTYLEGTYSEVYPAITQDEAGLQRLFKQFSFPGGIPSHVAPETPRLHPRRRRARLLAEPRVRRGVRQSRPRSSPA